MSLLGTEGHRLTRIYNRLEGEVAFLGVKGEFVNLHPAGTDQHQVIPKFNITIKANGEITTWRSLVLLCPVKHILPQNYLFLLGIL